MDRYAWSCIVDHILGEEKQQPDVGARIVDAAIELCREANTDFSAYEMLRPPIFALMKSRYKEVWPTMRAAISAADVIAQHHWNLLFLDDGPGKESASALEIVLPSDILLWARNDSRLVLSFVPRKMPLYHAGSNGVEIQPIFEVLLDEFGDCESLLDSAAANLEEFSFVGFAHDIYEERRRFLETLQAHRRPTVARWARALSESFTRRAQGERERKVEWDAGILNAPFYREMQEG
jgi:hypothetical protein